VAPPIPLALSPAPAGAKKLILVFQGRLGGEDGAVAGRVRSWEAPFVFAVQERVELWGEEVREELVRGAEGRIRRYSEVGQQRLTGRFVAPGATEAAGTLLKRVAVQAHPVFGRSSRLRLDGAKVGGPEWTAATSAIHAPGT
jgi:hypothetical protein